jgi:hypothetical protein
MEQLISHLLGDYFLQNNWMAMNKHKNPLACIVHCFLYTLPFLLITTNINQLFLIFSTHVIVDGSNIVKNISALTLKGCPDYLIFFISVVRDNTVHLICNYLILKYIQ